MDLLIAVLGVPLAGALTFAGFLVATLLGALDHATPPPPPVYCPVCRCIQDEHRESARRRWWKRNRVRRLGMPQVCKHHLRALQLYYPADADMARTMTGFMRYAGRIVDA